MKQACTDLLIFMVCLLLAGCMAGGSQMNSSGAQGPETPIAMTSQSVPAEVTTTSHPDLVPTLHIASTATPSSTSLLPTPSLPSWVMEDFFFGSSSPDCALPCWQGLMVGESKSDDIQALFNTTFGFNGTYSLLSDPVIRNVTGVYGKAHSWRLSNEPPESFTIIVWIDENTNILKGLHFRWTHWSRNALDSHMSPQRIIRELGQPTYMLTTKGATERGDTGIADLLMIYNNGLAFYASIRVPVTHTTGNPVVEICLGGERWNGEHNAMTREAYVMEPLTDLDHLSPLQQRLIGITIEDYKMRPFEEVFGATLEEVTKLALQEGDACLHADLFDK